MDFIYQIITVLSVVIFGGCAYCVLIILNDVLGELWSIVRRSLSHSGGMFPQFSMRTLMGIVAVFAIASQTVAISGATESWRSIVVVGALSIILATGLIAAGVLITRDVVELCFRWFPLVPRKLNVEVQRHHFAHRRTDLARRFQNGPLS